MLCCSWLWCVLATCDVKTYPLQVILVSDFWVLYCIPRTYLCPLCSVALIFVALYVSSLEATSACYTWFHCPLNSVASIIFLQATCIHSTPNALHSVVLLYIYLAFLFCILTKPQVANPCQTLLYSPSYICTFLYPWRPLATKTAWTLFCSVSLLSCQHPITSPIFISVITPFPLK
jgi:hypothetical protein